MNNTTQNTALQKIPYFQSVVIGAGLAGSLLAKKLMQKGHSVCVIEKSRGTGGRASSKRLESTVSGKQLNADLGLTSIQLNTPELKSLRDELLEQSVIAPWNNAHKNETLDQNAESTAFVGTPKSSAITRYLLGDATLITSTTAHHIEKTHSHWLIRDNAYAPIARCENLIITAPPAQTAMLLATTESASEQLHIAHRAGANTTPQWAMWIETPKRPIGHQLKNSGNVIDTYCLESRKPEKTCDSSEIWVIQTTSEWATRHLDAAKEWIASQLVHEFKHTTQLEVLQFGQPHRWLLGRQQNATPQIEHVWNERVKLGIAGDWLYSGDGQGALLSAHYLIEKMN
ncbi:NAD(P)/FAD-dependent oxidoreductase [Marinomonas balearica]|uniref:Amine oxidase domain-containing protein n=1 Tax=Marinomonas balearica TaxID=491947 RepID=A0A4R6MAV5_9GAMM|nr:NAD(P)-binding protein [Marinomonas balearica]TDO98225.1 hypothetical protein DFP79_1864 [Marinomonas balearica]